MPRFERFTFLVNKDERRLIASLAEQLQRSQSDAIRFVVINAAKELQAQTQTDRGPALQGVQDAAR
jgi:hypothetical protein